MDLKGLGVLQVEPTDVCNLKCLMCTPHFDQWEQIHNIPKGYLSVELWRKVVDSFVQEDLRFDHIIFQWLGDPLLHPKIVEIITIAAQHLRERVGYLRMDTNAILLTFDRIQRLCRLACQEVPPILLVFSIDAHTESVYHTVKGADKLALVKKNIRRFVRMRSRLGEKCRINIQLQFVVQSGNSDEVLPFLAYWSDLLSCQGGSWHDEIMFKRLSVDGGGAGQAAADALYERSVLQKGLSNGPYKGVSLMVWEKRPWQNDDANRGERRACPALWMTPVIRHDGTLVSCCADLGSTLQLGSLHTHGFSQLWFSRKAQAIREEHLRGTFTGVCKSCGGINWYELTSERVQEYRTKASTL